MGYWISILLLHCLHSSIALPTGVERKHKDVSVGQLEASANTKPEIGVVAHEIAPRVQDPTENLICRLYKTYNPQGVIMVPTTPALPPSTKYSVTPESVGLREYLYSPGAYAALCVSPEKPKPFPFFFAPPAPLAAAPVGVVVPKQPNSKAPAVSASALSAPAPAISLVFSSPIGSIGIGSVSSPAVNIGTQSIADQAHQSTWLMRGIILPTNI